MKLTKKICNLLAIVMLLASFTAQAATYGTPKRELRSAWVATVWALDWPKTTVSSTGNANEISKQKSQLTELLDSLKNNNMNAIYFQVRSMCDAMYKSSYEPWSSYLVSERGMDPGWDPLQFAVEESHKRGMECHAWVNPYRFSTGSKWNTAQDQKLRNDGMLLTYGSTVILNPGLKATRERITNVVKEIVKNYDVDGVVFDDYFYPNGIPSDESAGDYQLWKDSGTSLSIGDWRRDNVNQMVKDVHEAIQSLRPEVAFGISPAGVACSSSALAKKYGIAPCPGSDWQYSGIFSDPVAWIANKSLDYISPQVYWTIGYSSADYAKITPWWGKTAHKFDRHVYISHSISSLTYASTGSLPMGASGIEQTIAKAPVQKASGPNNKSYDEYVNEVELNRSSNLDDAPGSVYYSCKYLYALNAKESFAHYLRRTVYSRPALPPVMSWKAGKNPGVVKNLQKVAYTLSWDGYSNVRYTVYAVPEGVKQTDFNKDVDYLLGMTYGTTFEIPEAYRTGYQYAVCVLDRVGNEYSPIFLGAPAQSLPAPLLVTPANGAKVQDPFNFVWHPVKGATEYTLEVATDKDFNNVTNTYATTDTVVSTAVFEKIKGDVKQYWRVHACALNYADGVSEAREFTPMVLALTYPQPNAVNVNPAFTATWSTLDDQDVTLEISTDDTFSDGTIAYSGTSGNGSLKVADFALAAGVNYYARLVMTRDGVQKVSATVPFTTMFMTGEVPAFSRPVSGGELYANQTLAVTPQQAAMGYKIEVSADNKFSSRTRFIESTKDQAYTTSKTAGEIKVNSKLMTDGATYYARACTRYYKSLGMISNTGWCSAIPFVYRAQNSAVDGIGTDASLLISGMRGGVRVTTGSSAAAGYICNMQGAIVARYSVAAGSQQFIALPAGLYVAQNGTKLIVR